MARKIEWRTHTQSELTDYIGDVGHLKSMFTLSQLGTPEAPQNKWQLTARYLKSKHSKKVFTDVEEAKQCCQEIVDALAGWLASSG